MSTPKNSDTSTTIHELGSSSILAAPGE